MANLTIDIFTSSIEDQELSTYKVLASLKNYEEQLHKNQLYPAFSELIDILNMLTSLMNKKESFKNLTARKISGIDLENKTMKYEYNRDVIDELNMSKMFDFIDWAIPKILEVVNEGTAIFDYVESQIKIKEIGILPFYKNEGYFLVPDHKNKEVHIFRFQLSSIINSEVPVKSLKTNFIESIEQDDLKASPENIKLELIKKFHDLPNPATYKVCTELDMPFNETILPIAKRKMIRQLAA